MKNLGKYLLCIPQAINCYKRKIMPTIQKRQQTAFQIHVWRPLQQSLQRPQLVPLQRPLRVQINWRNLFYLTDLSVFLYFCKHKYKSMMPYHIIQNNAIILFESKKVQLRKLNYRKTLNNIMLQRGR